jgi:hypothetical protein
MFDLDKEIHAWCRSIHSNGWKRASSNAELMDHLYCEVERLSEEGLSEKQAFLAATERLGNVEDLRIEHSKNRNLLSTFSEFLLPNSRLRTGGADMSKASSHPKPLLPTITMAIGILIGGLLGAVVGSLSGNESVTIACYILGFLGGAVAGAMLGWRCLSRKNPNAAHSQ